MYLKQMVFVLAVCCHPHHFLAIVIFYLSPVLFLNKPESFNNDLILFAFL